MSDRDELRKLIQDFPRLEIGKLVGYGDATRTVFILPRRPLLADGLEICIDGDIQTPGTDYTVDLQTGGLTFALAPEADAEITTTYHFVALSDDELDSALSRNPGSIYLAAAEAIHMLLAGRGRLVNFVKADGRVDFNAVRNNLEALAKHYLSLGAVASGPKVESFDYPPSTDSDSDS